MGRIWDRLLYLLERLLLRGATTRLLLNADVVISFTGNCWGKERA